MNKIYDVIIIGGGPCGMTSAIYTIRNKLKTLILTKDIGGQMGWSGVIENYSGFDHITGPGLTMKFDEHVKKLGAEIRMNSDVKNIRKDGNYFYVETNKETFKTVSVLIASGKQPKYLNIKGEEEFKNRGVVYCAVCDGPLYSNRIVAVVGGGNSALDAALMLKGIAKHVYIINKNPSMKGDVTLLEQVKGDNVTIIYNALTKEIKGERVVKSIVMDTPKGEKSIDVDGVFVQIGLNPNSDFIDFIEKNEYREIIVDQDNRTNCPGIFAAGDVTNVTEKQIIIAAGEGSKAALTIFKYVMKMKK